MALQALLKSIEQQEWVDIPEGWLQGRTIYGGLVAGMMLYKAQQQVKDESKQLLSCSIVFVGPVQPSPVKLTAEVLRQGKSVMSIEVRIWQNDAVQSILVASFGRARPSNISVAQQPEAPDFPDVERLPRLPNLNLAPECFRQFEIAWASGNAPFSGSADPDFSGWFRFDTEKHSNRAMSEADLLILADIWPPGVLPMFEQVAPASSLTWHLTMLRPMQYQLHDWFKYRVHTEFAADGYSTEQAQIWDADNHLIAISRQTVTVFS